MKQTFQKINFAQYYDKVIQGIDINALPEELFPEKILVWDMDIDNHKDWDDFTGGQLVAHTYWAGAKKNDDGTLVPGQSHSARIDIAQLQYGNNPNTYKGMLNMNETITIYTKDYIDLDGKLVSIGNNIQDKYVPVSYELTNVTGKKGEVFSGKIILINIKRAFDDTYNEGQLSNVINIENGKIGETVIVPKITKTAGTMYNPEEITIDAEEKINAVPRNVEILLSNPAVTFGIDFVSNSANGDPLSDRKIEATKISTKTNTLPQNPFYSIAPVQFNILSLDNYGWARPGDQSNSAKLLAATQAMGNVANTGFSLGSSLGFPSAVSGIGQATIGLAQKFFGDKGSLANSGAISPSSVSGDGDTIKLFIQGDGKDSAHVDDNGYLNLGTIKNQRDYLEMNQSNGQMGKFGKSMSPGANNNYNDTAHYRGLGLKSIHNISNMPWLATPFSGHADYDRFKIDDTKINDFMKVGAPRQKVNSGDVLPPMKFPNNWDVYVRNMFFRPDPYSFWNWPAIMPAEIGVYDVVNETSISYDYVSAASDIISTLANPGESSSAGQLKKSYWNKTIELSKLTDNDLYDPNKTFTSFRWEFADGKLNDLYQMQMAAFTSSQIIVRLLDDKDEIIREHTFNSQGLNVGSSASWGTVVQF